MRWPSPSKAATTCCRSATAPSRRGRWSSCASTHLATERWGRPVHNTNGQSVPRRRFGAWSLILAAAGFTIAVASIVITLNIPKAASLPVQDLASYVFVGGFLIAAPLLHLVGVGL